MNGEPWPSQQLRPMLRIRLALVYLQLLFLKRTEAGDASEEAPAAMDAFDERVARTVGEEYVRADGDGVWDRIDATSEYLFGVTGRLSLTEEEEAAVSMFLDTIGEIQAMGGFSPLERVVDDERTEWAVMCTAYFLGIADEVGDPDALHPRVLDATLTAMYSWVRTENGSAPGEMSERERRELHGTIAAARERVTAPDSERVSVPTDLTADRESRRRTTEEWPDPSDYAEMVDPLAVRARAVEVAGREEGSGPEHRNVRQVAALYAHVRDEIDYVSDPNRNYVAPPGETLSVGGGDCDCQAVLAASLFEAVGAATYLAEVESERGGHHLLPLVDLGSPAQRDWITDRLSSYYDGEGTRTGNFSWQTTDDAIWFLADPVIGRYVGDRHRLAEAGFAREHDDGWEWYAEPTWYRSGV